MTKYRTNVYLIIAALFGFLGVALGAFGAHGLKNQIDPDALEIFKTGTFYHLIHSIVLLVLAIANLRNMKTPFILFVIGIIFFSFSLYFYSVWGIKYFVFITPIGGIILLSAWLSLALIAFKQNK